MFSPDYLGLTPHKRGLVFNIVKLTVSANLLNDVVKAACILRIKYTGFNGDKNKILSISESRHEESGEMRFCLLRADIFKPEAEVIGDLVNIQP